MPQHAVPPQGPKTDRVARAAVVARPVETPQVDQTNNPNPDPGEPTSGAKEETGGTGKQPTTPDQPARLERTPNQSTNRQRDPRRKQHETAPTSRPPQTKKPRTTPCEPKQQSTPKQKHEPCAQEAKWQAAGSRWDNLAAAQSAAARAQGGAGSRRGERGRA